MSFFKRKKKIAIESIQKVGLMPLDYPSKIILAWSQAVSGKEEFLIWLNENGYPELTMSCYAIRLKDDAREWLMKNGYAHLMAFINAAEGNEGAQKWLLKNDFHLLYHMAMSIEDDQESWKWLGENASSDLFILTKAIQKVKDAIEENHNDVHSFRKDL